MNKETQRHRTVHPPAQGGRRRQPQDINLAACDELGRAVLDSLISQVAVLAPDGTILLANRAWRRGIEGSVPQRAPRSDVGTNYIESCRNRGAVAEVSEGVKAVLDGRQDEFRLEYTCAAPGAPRSFLMTVTPLQVAGGGAVVVHTDITGQKMATEALWASEERFRALVEHGFEGISVVDASGAVLYSGPGNERILGYAPHDVLHTGSLDYVHKDDAAHVRTVLAEIRHGPEKTASLCVRVQARDGTWRWIEASVRNLLNHPGARGIVINWRDVTRRKEAEDALRQREQRLKLALAATELGVWEWDPRTDFMYWSPECCRIFGVESCDGSRASFARLIHPKDWPRMKSALDAAIRSRRPFRWEFRIVRPNGDVRWVSCLGETVCDDPGNHPHVVGTVRDVTQGRRVQAELKRQRTELQLILDAVPALIFFKDRRHRLIRVNREVQRLIGLPREAIEGRTDAELGSPHAARYWQDDEEVIATGQPKRSIVEPVVTTAGVRWLQTDKLPYRDAAGRITGVLGFSIDITDRKLAQDRVQRFVSASPAVIYALAIDEGGVRPTWISDNVRELTGYDVSAALAPGWWGSRIHDDDQQLVMDAFQAPNRQDCQVLNLRFRHRDGHYVWLRDQSRLIRDAAGRPAEIIGSWSDITEWIELEEQLRQSQKMEAVGKLAGGVAHDFNNLLTIIQNYTSILMLGLPVDDARREQVGEIRQAAGRAAALTRQLLAFSRKQVLARRVVDLNDVIRGVESMLRRLIGEDIALSLRLAPGTTPVNIDPGQMEQVLVNLAVNARDAMPAGGRLTIETRIVETEERAVTGGHDGDRLRVLVTDTGCGMDAGVQSRIFEPFFTTKPPGKGTGLGLSTVYGIVHQFGGQISVSSLPGVGTTFQIDLPLVPESCSRSAALRRPADQPHRSPTILVVDDDAAVRGSSRLVLVAEGYHVLEAADGHEALRLVDTHPDVIDLVVTDLAMPGMGGRELAAVLKARRPDIRVLFVSGFSDEGGADPNRLKTWPPLLHKPFSPATLCRWIDSALSTWE
jgi:PAS domain S-box-containing protein